ncbi:hypothetical protein CPC08DRAFT_821334 [Agrocybe pediades]|nr:hypothetical protein CPC08DRAFT_821334 [Agrocybe pediades]
MSTEPPAKRQRTEDASDTASKQDESPQKSYLWFEDGNVVLQAEKTLFRVHKTVLALHSEFFADMFSICHSQHESQPMFEAGCPLISTADSAADLTCLLSSIYENQKKHNPGREIEGTRAAALYRLGNKYGIDYLRDEMLLRLKIFFPSTLQDYQLDREYEMITATLPPAFRDLLLDRKFIIHPFGTLTVQDMMALANLAYQYKIMIVLPAVYARFAHLSNVWIAFNTSLLEFKDLKDPLNPEFLNTCFVGKERIASAIQKAVSVRVGSCNPLPPCDRRPKCTATASDILWQIGSIACNQGIRCFILSVQRVLDSSDLPVCEKCVKTVMTTEYEPIREELWDNLPTYFGLPTWEEIKSGTS